MLSAAPPVLPLFDLVATRAPMRPALDEAWTNVMADGRFVGGPFVEAFESAFARRCGVSSCVGVGNGTDALELLLEALGVGPGDDVLVPANTFVATVEAVVRSGARPVFCDVDPDTLLLSPGELPRRATARTAAVIAVHLFGQPCDMDELADTAERLGLALVEDAAQAHGARWRGRPVGSFGAGAAFSFYPSKNLGGLGDGGAVTTDDAFLAARIRSLADHGRTRDGSGPAHVRAGRNSRLDALQAAALSVGLDHLERQNGRRRELAAHYGEILPPVVRPVTTHRDATAVHHLQVVRCRVPRSDVTRSLDAAAIGWSVHYPTPCHRLPWVTPVGREGLRVAERAAAEILSLPMGPWMGRADVERVAEALAA